uniref:Piwi domain-containing protein n=2 Tax=Compsopogon caeruleus TaxID=31354 RepID=A0A7S1TFQ9_9RHOD|mmetsp:Transcript_518/g.976  ORF Transcript_518/g.976 Transcript_518/m.976 type:complete len:882 (+) Transcript_518:155-2800(+)|eukprot:CAMPEP_0184685944 /NCGR_PEP_ID=MMETSP0312-20130426/20789_1 /TAXON_ID=31354 /ORGANISM="Compsopogon coeruleus, Strain SAG 36.94" /LENGTH=881 /DNA_ID=CAMNT_0027140561 /DNA_START=91 /DNA_END=2736 /DNA_ORIENTATION=-
MEVDGVETEQEVMGGTTTTTTTEEFRPVRRPGIGTAGQTLQVTSNFYTVELTKELGGIQQFDVTVIGKTKNSKSDRMSPNLLRKVITALETQHEERLGGARFAYDGRDLAFSDRAIDLSNDQFEVKLAEDDTFTVHLKRTRTADINELMEYIATGGEKDDPDHARQALQIILSTGPKEKYKSIGSSFYYPENAVDLGRGCEAWRGFHHSLRVLQGGLTLNVDISYSPFYQSRMADEVVLSILNFRGPPREVSDRERLEIERELRGLLVKTTHRDGQKGADRSLKIIGISRFSAEQDFFTNRDGREVSVASYFDEAYKPLLYPQLPCAVVERIDRGRGPKPDGKGPPLQQRIPFEVLKICPGQKRTKKLRDQMVASMIRACNVKPRARLDEAAQSRAIANYEEDPVANLFGISVAKEPLNVSARLLDPPTLHFNIFSQENQETPINGQWNMRNKMAYFSGQTLSHWGVLVLVDERMADNRRVQDTISGLLSACEEKGIKVENSNPPVKRDPYSRDVLAAMTDLKNMIESRSNGEACQLVLVIKDVDNEMYKNIKTASDISLGFPSQCALAKNLTKGPQYFGNITLKVNAKLGGRNWVLSAEDLRIGNDNDPFMVLGSCVTKPQNRSNTNGVASLVGSLDPQLGSYATTFTNQDAKDPYIIEMKSMVAIVLRRFRSEWGGKLPMKLLFYRDGASEGAFPTIMSNEIADIKAACASVEPGYEPKLTFIITTKRHHARFCPPPNFADRSGNCKPGTVIDAGICHARNWDFYLFSHSGIQGTSRPARYTVLLDEIGFDADSLQRITYNLCYTYARCPRSVSYVPVAYYAQLYGLRILHIQGGDDEFSDRQSVASGAHPGQGEEPVPAEPKKFNKIHERLETVMFYM